MTKKRKGGKIINLFFELNDRVQVVDTERTRRLPAAGGFVDIAGKYGTVVGRALRRKHTYYVMIPLSGVFMLSGNLLRSVKNE